MQGSVLGPLLFIIYSTCFHQHTLSIIMALTVIAMQINFTSVRNVMLISQLIPYQLVLML